MVERQIPYQPWYVNDHVENSPHWLTMNMWKIKSWGRRWGTVQGKPQPWNWWTRGPLAWHFCLSVVYCLPKRRMHLYIASQLKINLISLRKEQRKREQTGEGRRLRRRERTEIHLKFKIWRNLTVFVESWIGNTLEMTLLIDMGQSKLYILVLPPCSRGYFLFKLRGK